MLFGLLSSEVSTLREEIFAGIDFRKLFFGYFAGIHFRYLEFTKDFAENYFRCHNLCKDLRKENFFSTTLFYGFEKLTLFS